MNKLKITALAVFLTAIITGCGEKPQEKTEPVKKAAPKPVAVKPAEAVDVSAQIEPTVKAKKRNPFANYLITIKGTEKAAKVKGPLECCDVGAFKLLAVVNSPDNAFALIQAPDAKRYIVRKGDTIGIKEGKIVKFGTRSITVREAMPDEPGRPPVMVDIEIKLPLEPEVKR